MPTQSANRDRAQSASTCDGSGATPITVAANSQLGYVAATIAGVIRAGRPVSVQAMGAVAGQRAMQAAAIAHCYLRAEGIGIVCSPFFATTTVDSGEQVLVRLDIAKEALQRRTGQREP